MIRWQLHTQHGEATVTLDATNPPDVAGLIYEGPEAARVTVRAWLAFEGGAFGNLIGDQTTPLDLEVAMHLPAAQRFKPERKLGKPITDYDPAVGADAVP